MEVPDYYLPRLPLSLTSALRATFEAAWERIAAAAEPLEMTGISAEDRWRFLCYLADTKPVVLHGSGQLGLEELKPRHPNDFAAFGNQCAIYAASDGLWPIYFAILDRERHPMSINNSCFRIATSTGELGEPFYFFSITASALRQKPWRSGTVYILPRAPFEPQPPLRLPDADVYIQQWACTISVRPLAWLSVTPEDFPFLKQIRGHDDDIQQQRAERNPDGFPWLDDDL